MNLFQSLFIRFFILLISSGCTVQSFSQVKNKKNSFLGHNWTFDLKAGSGTFFSGIPDQFLNQINGVNIPSGLTAPTGVFTFRKEVLPHFELGYQLDYMFMRGQVKQEENTYLVKTHTTSHNLVILYKLRGSSDLSAGMNYLIYYKIGKSGIHNDARQKFSDGTISTVPEYTESDKFIRDKTLTTGIGIGVTQVVSDHFKFIGTFELNRSTYAASDIYKIYKIFYRPEYTISNYAFLAAGLSYTFSIQRHKNHNMKHSGVLFSRKQTRTKARNAKRESSNLPKSLWFNQKG